MAMDPVTAGIEAAGKILTEGIKGANAIISNQAAQLRRIYNLGDKQVDYDIAIDINVDALAIAKQKQRTWILIAVIVAVLIVVLFIIFSRRK